MQKPQLKQRIVIWRHGQTDWNIENRFQGHSDIPLNDVGLYQARRSAEVLAGFHPTKIVSSDLVRAVSTGQALADLVNLSVLTDRDLRETNGGKWEGKTGDENRAQDFERFTRWIDGNDEPAGEIGERRSDVATRALKAIDRALDGHEGTLVVVTHGGTARCLLGRILQLPIEHWAVVGGLSNAAWSVIERGIKPLDRNNWILVEHNAGSLPQPVLGEESGGDAKAR